MSRTAPRTSMADHKRKSVQEERPRGSERSCVIALATVAVGVLAGGAAAAIAKAPVLDGEQLSPWT
jgi:hypothetical protein